MTRSPATSITILGSGTCVPSLSRSACSVRIVSAGKTLVCDTGPGTMRRLLEAGTTIFDIDCLLYSHLHPDHTAELVPLLFATKYPDSGQRKKPLTIVAGRGFRNFFAGLERIYGEWIQLDPGLLRIVECDTAGPDRNELAGVTIDTMPMAHRPESIGFRMTDTRGRTVAYSGDTDACEELVALARDVDVLICESALPDALKVPGHLTPSLAGDIAARAGVRRLVLTHFYPECDQADIRRECERVYAGNLVLAEDLMTLTLDSEETDGTP